MSELLTIALNDLEKVEKDPIYQVRMDVWHQGIGRYGDQCAVCLAGAVLAKTLEVDPSLNASPGRMGSVDNVDQLLAIDKLRSGGVSLAASRLRLTCSIDLDDRFIPDYRYNHNGFHQQLRQLAADLRRFDL
jgi:hypothetical protein